MSAIDGLRRALVAANVDLSKVSASDVASQAGAIPESLRGVSFEALAKMVGQASDRGAEASSQIGTGRGSTAAVSVDRVAHGSSLLATQARALQTTPATPAPGKTEAPAIVDPPATPSIELPQKDSFTAREFVAFANEQLKNYDTRAHEIQDIIKSNTDRLNDVKEGRAQAMAELTTLLLPALTPEAWKNCMALTGMCEALSPLASLTTLESGLKQKLSMLQSQAGQKSLDALKTQVDRLATNHETAKAAIAAFQPEVLDGLIERNFGTENDGRWHLPWGAWRDDKNAADELVSTFGARDYDDLVSKYTAAKAAVQAAKSELTTAQADFGRVSGLSQEMATIMQQLRELPATALAEGRKAIAKFIGASDRAVLAKTLEANPQAMGMFRRFDATTAKVEYLEDLIGKFQETYTSLTSAQAQLAEDVRKYNGKKRGETVPYKSARWKLGCDDWAKRDKYVRGCSRASQTVYVYNTYDSSPSFIETWFWWNVFTGGNQFDRYYAPSDYSSYRDSHPDWVAPQSQNWDTGAAASNVPDPAPAPDPVDPGPQGPGGWDPNHRSES